MIPSSDMDSGPDRLRGHLSWRWCKRTGCGTNHVCKFMPRPENDMKQRRRTMLIACSGLLWISAGCGGHSIPSTQAAPQPAAVSVSVSPNSATVNVSATTQFTATVANSINQAVTWQVNGNSGGNANVGYSQSRILIIQL